MISYAGSGGRSGWTIAERLADDNTDLDGVAYVDSYADLTGPTCPNTDRYDIPGVFIHSVPSDYYDVMREIESVCNGNWWDWYRWTPEYPPEKLRVRDYRTVLPVKRIINQPIRNGFKRGNRYEYNNN